MKPDRQPVWNRLKRMALGLGLPGVAETTTHGTTHAQGAWQALGMVEPARGRAGVQGSNRRARHAGGGGARHVLLYCPLQGSSDGSGTTGRTRPQMGTYEPCPGLAGPGPEARAEGVRRRIAATDQATSITIVMARNGVARRRLPPPRAGPAPEQGPPPRTEGKASSAAGAETTIVGDCDRLLPPPRRSHPHSGREHAAEMRAVVEAACEGDIGDGRSAVSGADNSRAARFTRSSQSRAMTVSPAFGEDLLQQPRARRRAGRHLAGGEIGIIEAQGDEATGAGVKVGASRCAQAACFRCLGGVPRRPDRQRDEIVDVADGEPADSQCGNIVSEEDIGVAGQQPDGLRVDRDRGQHGSVEVGDRRRKVPLEQGIVGQARSRSAPSSADHGSRTSSAPLPCATTSRPRCVPRGRPVVDHREYEVARRIDGHLAAALDAQRARRDLRDPEPGQPEGVRVERERVLGAVTSKFPTLLQSMSR